MLSGAVIDTRAVERHSKVYLRKMANNRREKVAFVSFATISFGVWETKMQEQEACSKDISIKQA